MSAMRPQLEARAQALFQGEHRLGRPVGGDDDLLVLTVQGVEGVEELFLGGLFAGDELDVIDEQDVDAAIFVAEGLRGVAADGVDQVVGKLLGGDIQHLQTALRALVTNGMQQVGLAQPDAAVQEEWVVRLGRFLGYRLGGGMRQAVAGANHKVFKGIARVQGGVLSLGFNRKNGCS